MCQVCEEEEEEATAAVSLACLSARHPLPPYSTGLCWALMEACIHRGKWGDFQEGGCRPWWVSPLLSPQIGGGCRVLFGMVHVAKQLVQAHGEDVGCPFGC